MSDSDLRATIRAIWPWRIFHGRVRDMIRHILKRLKHDKLPRPRTINGWTA